MRRSLFFLLIACVSVFGTVQMEAVCAEEGGTHQWKGEFRSLGSWWRYQSVLETSADGTTLLIGSNGKHLVFYDLTQGKTVRKLATREGMQDATLSPDGKLLAVAEWRDGFTLRDAETFKVLKSFSGSEGNGAGAVRFTPDGNRLLCYSKWFNAGSRTSRKQLFAYEVHADNLEELRAYRQRDLPTTYVRESFSRNGCHLYSLERTRNQGSITGFRFWVTDPLTGEVGRPIELDEEDSKHYGTSPDGRRALVQRPGSPVRVIDTKTGETLVELENRNWTSRGSFSPDGRLIATVRGAKFLGGQVTRRFPKERHSNVVLHDARTGKELARLEHPGIHRDYYHVCFSRNNQYVVCTTAEKKSEKDGRSIREVILWGNLPSMPQKMDPLPTFENVKPPEETPRKKPGKVLPSGIGIRDKP